MSERAADFQAAVAEKVKLLEPLFEEAATADRVFHEAWQQGTQSPPPPDFSKTAIPGRDFLEQMRK